VAGSAASSEASSTAEPTALSTALDTALTAYANAAKPVLGGTTAARKLAGLVQWAEDYLTSPAAQHPAEIPGYGMIPADAALLLLAAGSPLRRLLIDETDGRLLHYGTKTYLVPPPLADHLIALHVTSAGPPSNISAAGCDMEHNVPHDQDGTTDPINNSPVDRRWHRAKTHAGWSYLKNRDGTVTWTSPHGLTEVTPPYDYRTDTQ
jgi:hypothetical protein